MNLDYQLLDYGNGVKLERFGCRVILRPEPRAIEAPKISISKWKQDSICRRISGTNYIWDPLLDPWLINFNNLKLKLKLSNSKNIGIFPEQESNWLWLTSKIKPNMKILNLFAYTGVASLVCAKLGASVCHVDASKSSIKHAIENAMLNKIQTIRWITDDVFSFLKREISRNIIYDGIILDPPPYGSFWNKKFLFKKDIFELLNLCAQVSSKKPSLFLINCYAVRIKKTELMCLVKNKFPFQSIETGDLKLSELLMSFYARF